MRDSCLLCNSTVPSSSPTSTTRSSSRISNQLRVIFLLRHVFEVPRESLELHLATHHKHPSEWIDLCDLCQDIVKKAHRIYQEFLKISRVLRSVKIDIIDVTRRSFQTVPGGGSGSNQDQDDASNVNVTIAPRKIRQFVNNYDYGQYINTFTVTPEQFGETGPKEDISESEVKVEAESNDVDVDVQEFSDSNVDLVGGDEDFEDEVRGNHEIVNSDSGDGDALSGTEGSDGSDSDIDSTYSEKCPRRSTSSKSRRFKGRRSSNSAAIGRQRAKEYEMKRNARKLIRDANTLYLPCPFCHETAKDYSDEGEKTLCDHLEECQYLLTKVTSDPEPKLKCPTCTAFQCSSYEEQEEEMNAKARFVEHLGFCKLGLPEGHRVYDHHDFDVIPLEKRIFVCNVCPKKVYIMLDEFIRHIVYHQRNTFQCTKCRILFETSLAVENHWQLEHDVGEDDDDGDLKWTQEPVILPAADWWCPLCNHGPFPTDDTRDEHLKTSHSEGEFSEVLKTRNLGCSWCPKQYASRLELRLHRNTFHFREHNSFKCDHVDCQNENDFQTESELKEHRISQHQLDFLYTCHLCGEQLTSRHIWLHHLEAHQKAGKNSQTCEFCNKAFRTAMMLKRHIRVDHKKLDRVPCDLCEKTFKNEFHLRSHLGCHGLGDIPCTQEGCAQKFPTQRKLTLHLAKVHKIGEFKCSICNKGFFTRTLLERHGRVHVADRPFKCDLCSKGFKDQYNLKLHVSLHEKPNFRPTKEWDRVDLDGNRRSGGPTSGVCDLCGKMVRNLTTHQRICHGPNSSKKVKKHAASSSKGERAKQSKKTGESPKKEPVTCDLCGRMVKHLYHHKSQVHGDSSGIAHICDICGQSFRCRVYLNTHVRHTHEKRLSKVCEICGQGFSSTVHLTDHRVSKHGLESTQQFPCTFEGCDKIFKLKRQLYLHKKFHSSEIIPKECNQCGKTFKSSNVLARHLKTHKNRESKPYQCEGCHKRFAVRDYLNQHVKNHCPNKCK